MNRITENACGKLSRRDFLKLGTVGAGLVIGVNLSACSREPEASHFTQDETGGFRPSAYLRITADNKATIVIAEAEMGQGVWTALPMLVAEELELDWAAISVEHAPVHPDFGVQYTGGSTSIRSAWLPLRQVGAMARQMLINAAAAEWQVPAGECRAQGGLVIHMPTDRQFRYGELVEIAAQMPLPANVPLKDPEHFDIIGTTVTPLDALDKARGMAVFGTDVNMDGLLIATVIHCPVFGGRLRGFKADKARAVTGVRDVLQIDSGVAIVADTFWAAEKARRVLAVDWDFGANDTVSSESIADLYKASLGSRAVNVAKRGKATVGGSAKRLESTYELPFQAHATMEPMCCTAHVKGDECDIWVPTQAPDEAQRTAADYLLSAPERLLGRLQKKLGGQAYKQIRVHTTFLGGGFGRRLEQDFVAEAVQISRAVNAPVKLIWSREEDMQHDYYRPYTLHRLTAELEDRGDPVNWVHRVVGPGRYISAGCVSGRDYSIASFRQDFVEVPYSVPTGYWRSVSCSQTNFASECFIDELAAAAGRDPYLYRWGLLADEPRLRTVLELAAEKAGWSRDLPGGHFHGVAVNHSHGSFVAQVVELSIEDRIRLHKVTCVIDCGQVVSPDTVRAQMEGGIVFGLTACLKGAISIENGRAEQANFHDFPLLRIDEMPQVSTYIVPSKEEPGGVGEPGVPAIAPAVANALFAATGKRLRRLPITIADLS